MQFPHARIEYEDRDGLSRDEDLNASAIEAVARMFERADLLGHTEPEHYLWPPCQGRRYDPTKPMLKWDTAWRRVILNGAMTPQPLSGLV